MENQISAILKTCMLFILLLISSPSFADYASHCISLGESERGRTMSNQCDRDIIVFWCHNDNINNKGGFCDPEQKLYRKNTAG